MYYLSGSRKNFTGGCTHSCFFDNDSSTKFLCCCRSRTEIVPKRRWKN